MISAVLSPGARRDLRAMSLMEAIVAIVIVGVLAVVVFQSISTYRQMAEREGFRRTAVRLAEEAMDRAIQEGYGANDPSNTVKFPTLDPGNPVNGVNYRLEPMPAGATFSGVWGTVSRYVTLGTMRFRVQRSVGAHASLPGVRVVRIIVTWIYEDLGDAVAVWSANNLVPVEVTTVLAP